MILKDFVNGRILWCELPPDYDSSKLEKPINQSNEFDPSEIKAYETSKVFDEDLADEKLQVLEEFKEDGEKKFFEDQKHKITLEDLDVEDMELLQQGKTVKGIKLTKDQKREIKFAIKRGEVRFIQ